MFFGTLKYEESDEQYCFLKNFVKYAYLAFKYTYCFLKPIATILARNLSLIPTPKKKKKMFAIFGHWSLVVPINMAIETRMFF